MARLLSPVVSKYETRKSGLETKNSIITGGVVGPLFLIVITALMWNTSFLLLFGPAIKGLCLAVVLLLAAFMFKPVSHYLMKKPLWMIATAIILPLPFLLLFPIVEGDGFLFAISSIVGIVTFLTGSYYKNKQYT